MVARLEVTLSRYSPRCLVCENQVLLMLTRCIYVTKAEGSVSKQDHLQPRCHSKARSQGRQLFSMCSRAFRDSDPAIVVEGITNLSNISVRHEKRPKRICREFLFHWILLYMGISSVNFGQIEPVLHTIQYGLLTKCEVKMPGYWPSSFFACLWTETETRPINSQKKNEANVQPSWPPKLGQ